ncbi:uncharacterized protein JN550_005224 [Neoarthrinium moseri]|uniref:uncharacterized protein n=1 Tax=Neoarthrinium moseri TaxID=1658444 RepID=UPI001FDB2BDF|nr:uncharacterized protein JN550_005224 [Neoarthrinium moseri]KAI1870296.1 hypothetical protein JN550_005224 [Neoarthrinium moseri]
MKDMEDVFVTLKTGSNEAREKLPVHFGTTFRCVPHYGIYSDLEETIAGHRVLNALDDVTPAIVENHPDFTYYQHLQENGREGFSEEQVAQWSSAQSTEFGRDSPGWKLDKWKFLPLAEKALAAKPDAKWFVFMETDTYILWSNLLEWLSRFWSEYPYYIGVQMQIQETVFAYGGAGFILSNTALKMLVKKIKMNRRHYEDYTGDHWAGDCVLGKVVEDAGMHLQWSWPNLLAEHPNDMDFDEHFSSPTSQLWCHHVASYHHMLPEDIVQFYEFENKWRQMNGRTLRHKDVFRQYLLPQLATLQANWDNLSGEVRDEKSSLEECRSLCESEEDCVQFSIAGPTCKTSTVIKLGRRSHTSGMEVNSGWMMDRVHQFMDRMDASCWDEAWIDS